jgi:hypothetical protein
MHTEQTVELGISRLDARDDKFQDRHRIGALFSKLWTRCFRKDIEMFSHVGKGAMNYSPVKNLKNIDTLTFLSTPLVSHPITKNSP